MLSFHILFSYTYCIADSEGHRERIYRSAIKNRKKQETKRKTNITFIHKIAGTIDSMKNDSFFTRIIYTLILFNFFIYIIPCSMAAYVSPYSSLETDTQWVSKESLTLQWGKAQRVDINGVIYTLRADDFDVRRNAASILIEKEGNIIKEFLFANTESENSLIWDYEFKIELTGVSEDSSKTPSASVIVYERGLPELTVTLSAESQTYGAITVSETQYAPGKEKKITVDLKNNGDAWAENLVLVIDTDNLDVKSYKGFELNKNMLKRHIDWMDAGDSQTYNFTVIFPEWDGVTSPYAVNYTINATLSGNDIKNEIYKGNGSLSFTCTDPVLKVVSFVSKEELNMSSWYIKDMTVHDAWETTTFRVDIYNLGFYTVSNLDVIFPEIPDEFLIDDVFESGNPKVISKKVPYYIAKKLVPMRQGDFILNKTIATVDFFGKDFTWESESKVIKVHGADISLDKSLVKNGFSYDVLLKAVNNGDRAAWVEIHDYVPSVVNYVDGSLERSVPSDNMTLRDWDMVVTNCYNGSYYIGVKGVLLSPGDSLDLSYQIEPYEAPDLPYAECNFKAIEGYKGTVRSAFFKGGVRVEQQYDIVSGEWRAMELSEPTEVVEELYGLDMWNISENDSLQIAYGDSIHESTIFGKLLEKISNAFDSMELGLKSAFAGVNSIVGPTFSSVESIAVNAVENHLYAVIIVVAIGTFLIVVVLMQR